LKTRPRTAGFGAASAHSSPTSEGCLQDSINGAGNGPGRGKKYTKKHVHRSKSAGHLDCSGKRMSYSNFPFRGWLSESSAKKIQKKTEYGSSSVSNLYNTLLENEVDLSEDVADYLAENEELQRRKKTLLLREWTDKVYKPLKAEITEEMNGRNYKIYDRTKRDLYQEYLTYTNQKGNVFLDTISYDEYDPLSINGHRPGPLRVVIKKPKDPLLFQGEKRNEEEKVTIHCETGLKLTDSELEKIRLPPLPLVPLGRHGTDCNDLIAMGLNVIDSESRPKRQQSSLDVRSKESLDFEVWKKLPVNVDLVDKELRSQKKRQFRAKYKTTITLA